MSTRKNATKIIRDEPSFRGLTRTTFRWLCELELNNSTEWVSANEDALRRYLGEPFAQFLETTSAAFAADGQELQGGRRTMFRMRRDLRFTSDMRPLHCFVRGVWSQDGRKIGCRGAIEARLDHTGGCLTAGSFLQPPEALRALRMGMVAQRDRFLSIVQELAKDGIPLASDGMLKRQPRGFDLTPDDELSAFLRMQTPQVKRRMPKASWLSGKAVNEALHFARRTRPWRLFQTSILATVPERIVRPPRSPSCARATSGSRPS